jgi:hypothetical protein
MNHVERKQPGHHVPGNKGNLSKRFGRALNQIFLKATSVLD